MSIFTLNLNGDTHDIEADPSMPLLWAIRDILGLKGTKYGCGQGLCGACTIHMDGFAVRSCSATVSDAVGSNITSIEGLTGKIADTLKQNWEEEHVPQCGYCQSGQIMQAATLLAQTSNPSDEEIVRHMSANLCRCMAYPRIQKAIKRAAASINELATEV